MKLYYSHVSPYARKSIMMALAIGIKPLELILQSPAEKTQFRQWNPLGKIPFLIDEDTVLMDSALICEYLNERYASTNDYCFYQRGTNAYFDIQKQHTLANGIMDAAVNIILEQRRDDAEQSQRWMGLWTEAILASLSQLDINHLGSVKKPNIASFANIAMLEYLDFRMGHLAWREGHPSLVEWHDAMKQIDWVVSTRPS